MGATEGFSLTAADFFFANSDVYTEGLVEDRERTKSQSAKLSWSETNGGGPQGCIWTAAESA